MKNCSICLPFLTLGYHFCGSCGKRLKGVQGPERHLVGESRSDGPASGVQEAKPGRRGVEEIDVVTELLRLVTTVEGEARAQVAKHPAEDFPRVNAYCEGQANTLAMVREALAKISEKRSDLLNSEPFPPELG